MCQSFEWIIALRGTTATTSRTMANVFLNDFCKGVLIFEMWSHGTHMFSTMIIKTTATTTATMTTTRKRIVIASCSKSYLTVFILIIHYRVFVHASNTALHCTAPHCVPLVGQPTTPEITIQKRRDKKKEIFCKQIIICG